MAESTLFKRKIRHETTFIEGRQFEVFRVVERKRDPTKRLGGWSQAYKHTKQRKIPIFTLILGARVIQPHAEAA